MPYQNPYLPPAAQGYGTQFNQYGQQGYAAQGGSFGAMQQPIHGFVYVTGIEGAKAYQMPPNSEMPLFDSTNDGVMFVKTTDGAGFPTIKIVDCKERESQSMSQQPADYVTRDEFRSACSDLANQMEQIKGAVYGTVSPGAAAAQQPSGADGQHSPGDGWKPAGDGDTAHAQ